MITSEQLIILRKNRNTSPRTLDTLNTKHTAFLEAGGNLKKAKNFDNVIGSYFFDIPLTQVKYYKLYTLNFNNHNYIKVCPPGLHITLGVFQRLFDLLEEECHELDQWTGTTVSTRQSSYENYMEAKTCVTALREEELLTEQVKVAQQYLVLQLLTTPDPLQNTIVQSTSQLCE